MSEPDTDVTRRAYWSEQFDAAYRFMFDGILPLSLAECGEPLVSLLQVAQAADVRVAFSNKPHVQGSPRLYLLGDGQIPGFFGAARHRAPSSCSAAAGHWRPACPSSARTCRAVQSTSR